MRIIIIYGNSKEIASMFPKKFVSISVASCLMSSAALAQEVDTTQNQVIEEVLVSGQYLYTDTINALKTPTPILDVPQSLSIVSAEDIRARGFNSIGEVINYLPGVTTSQGEGHRDAVVFRGVRSTADFYIDGVRDDVQYFRPLYNLEQIEVLRGPNALLFGRGGTGGVLNRVTKKAQLDESFTASQVSADSLGEVGGQIDANVVVTETVAFRVNAMFERLDNHRDFYDGERVGVNPTLRIEAGDSRFDLSYEYIDHQRFIDRGIPTGSNGDPVERFDRVVFGDPDVNLTSLEAHIFIANLQHRFSDSMKGQITAFYGDYDKLYQNFYAAKYDQTASRDRVTLDGYRDTTQRENLILSGDLIGELETGDITHRFLTGLEFIETSNDNDRYNSFFSSNPSDRDVETFLIGNQVLRNGSGSSVTRPAEFCCGWKGPPSIDSSVNTSKKLSIWYSPPPTFVTVVCPTEG